VVFFMLSENQVPSVERQNWRDKLMIKTGISAGVLVLAATAASAKPASAAEKSAGSTEVGFSDNNIFNRDPAAAESVAQKIQQMGGNVVRIFYPLNKDTAWENYQNETCNAFKAAYDHQLQPIVAFRGYDGSPGYVPYSRKEITQFATTAASIIWTVASNKDARHPGGCVPEQKSFVFEGINEINNSSPFNRNLGVNTPVQALRIDSALSRALRKTAARPEIQATVSFGEALAAGNHDPIKFMNDQAQVSTKPGLNVQYDFVDIHPYSKDPTADPSLTMQALYKPALDSINTLSPGAKLVWGEIGVNTINPPASEAANYSPPVSNTVGVSETTQVKYITNILKTAASEGTPWVTLFGTQDDGSGSMPSSGEDYVSGKPKTSKPFIRYQIGKYTGR
jgi:hypothetical protein